jgi:hypothetical protein
MIILLLRSCPLPREGIYRAAAQKQSLFIRLFRGRCIATAVHADIYETTAVQMSFNALYSILQIAGVG